MNSEPKRPLPIFEVGDLVRLEDYEDKVWEVEGFYYEYMYLHGDEQEDMYYNLVCIESGKIGLGVEDELSLLSHAAYADSYMRTLGKGNIVNKWDIGDSKDNGKEVRSMEEREVRVRMTKKEKEEVINEVLDRYNDVMKFVEADGEATPLMQEKLDSLEREWEVASKAIIIDD